MKKTFAIFCIWLMLSLNLAFAANLEETLENITDTESAMLDDPSNIGTLSKADLNAARGAVILEALSRETNFAVTVNVANLEEKSFTYEVSELSVSDLESIRTIIEAYFAANRPEALTNLDFLTLLSGFFNENSETMSGNYIVYSTESMAAGPTAGNGQIYTSVFPSGEDTDGEQALLGFYYMIITETLESDAEALSSLTRAELALAGNVKSIMQSYQSNAPAKFNKAAEGYFQGKTEFSGIPTAFSDLSYNERVLLDVYAYTDIRYNGEPIVEAEGGNNVLVFPSENDLELRYRLDIPKKDDMWIAFRNLGRNEAEPDCTNVDISLMDEELTALQAGFEDGSETPLIAVPSNLTLSNLTLDLKPRGLDFPGYEIVPMREISRSGEEETEAEPDENYQLVELRITLSKKERELLNRMAEIEQEIQNLLKESPRDNETIKVLLDEKNNIIWEQGLDNYFWLVGQKPEGMNLIDYLDLLATPLPKDAMTKNDLTDDQKKIFRQMSDQQEIVENEDSTEKEKADAKAQVAVLKQRLLDEQGIDVDKYFPKPSDKTLSEHWGDLGGSSGGIIGFVGKVLVFPFKQIANAFVGLWKLIVGGDKRVIVPATKHTEATIDGVTFTAEEIELFDQLATQQEIINSNPEDSDARLAAEAKKDSIITELKKSVNPWTPKGLEKKDGETYGEFWRRIADAGTSTSQMVQELMAKLNKLEKDTGEEFIFVFVSAEGDYQLITNDDKQGTVVMKVLDNGKVVVDTSESKDTLNIQSVTEEGGLESISDTIKVENGVVSEDGELNVDVTIAANTGATSYNENGKSYDVSAVKEFDELESVQAEINSKCAKEWVSECNQLVIERDNLRLKIAKIFSKTLLQLNLISQKEFDALQTKYDTLIAGTDPALADIRAGLIRKSELYLKSSGEMDLTLEKITISVTPEQAEKYLELADLRERRDKLRAKAEAETITDAEKEELGKVSLEYYTLFKSMDNDPYRSMRSAMSWVEWWRHLASLAEEPKVCKPGSGDKNVKVGVEESDGDMTTIEAIQKGEDGCGEDDTKTLPEGSKCGVEGDEITWKSQCCGLLNDDFEFIEYKYANLPTNYHCINVCGEGWVDVDDNFCADLKPAKPEGEEEESEDKSEEQLEEPEEEKVEPKGFDKTYKGGPLQLVEVKPDESVVATQSPWGFEQIWAGGK